MLCLKWIRFNLLFLLLLSATLTSLSAFAQDGEVNTEKTDRVLFFKSEVSVLFDSLPREDRDSVPAKWRFNFTEPSKKTIEFDNVRIRRQDADTGSRGNLKRTSVEPRYFLQQSVEVEKQLHEVWILELIQKYGFPEGFADFEDSLKTEVKIRKEYLKHSKSENTDESKAEKANEESDKKEDKTKKNEEKGEISEMQRMTNAAQWIASNHERAVAYLKQIGKLWPQELVWEDLLLLDEEVIQTRQINDIAAMTTYGIQEQKDLLYLITKGKKDLGKLASLIILQAGVVQKSTGQRGFTVVSDDRLQGSTDVSFDAVGLDQTRTDRHKGKFYFFAWEKAENAIYVFSNQNKSDRTDRLEFQRHQLPAIPIDPEVSLNSQIELGWLYGNDYENYLPDFVTRTTDGDTAGLNFEDPALTIYYRDQKRGFPLGEISTFIEDKDFNPNKKENLNVVYHLGVESHRQWLEKLYDSQKNRSGYTNGVVGQTLNSRFNQIAKNAMSEERAELGEGEHQIFLHEVVMSEIYAHMSGPIRAEVALRFYETVRSAFGNSKNDLHLFLKLPKKYNFSHKESVGDIIRSMLSAYDANTGKRLFITIDVTEFEGKDAELGKIFNGIGDYLEQREGENAAIIFDILVIGAKSQIQNGIWATSRTDYSENSYRSLSDQVRAGGNDLLKINLDDYYTPQQKAEAIHAFFVEEKIKVELSTIQAALEEISKQLEPDSSAQEIVKSPDDYALALLSAYRRARLVDQKDPTGERIAKVFIQDHSELGDLHFPYRLAEIAKNIKSRLSATSARNNIEIPFIGLDRTLLAIQNRISAWFASGHKRDPFLTFTFMGKPSSGKTTLAREIANFFAREFGGVAFEKVDFSQFKISSEVTHWEKDALFKEVTTKLDRLRLNSNIVKVFLCDETHDRPDFMNVLKSSVGDLDRKGASLNLDGVIFIMVNNVPTKSSTLDTVQRKYAEAWDSEFQKYLKALWKESMNSQEESGKRTSAVIKINENTLDATYSRIGNGIFFIPNNNPQEENEYGDVEEVIQALESRYRDRGLEILVDISAKNHLKNSVGDRHEAGERRAVRKAMNEALDQAVDFLGGEKNLEGRMVLTTRNSRVSKEVELEFVSADRNDLGSVTFLKHQYGKITKALQDAINLWIEETETPVGAIGRMDGSEQGRKIAEAFRDAFSSSISQDLVDQDHERKLVVKPATPNEFVLPEEWTAQHWGLIQKEFENTIQGWKEFFSAGMNRRRRAPTSFLIEMLGDVRTYFDFLSKISANRDISQSKREDFDSWIRNSSGSALAREVSSERERLKREAENVLNKILTAGRSYTRERGDLASDRAKASLTDSFVREAYERINSFTTKFPSAKSSATEMRNLVNNILNEDVPLDQEQRVLNEKESLKRAAQGAIEVLERISQLGQGLAMRLHSSFDIESLTDYMDETRKMIDEFVSSTNHAYIFVEKLEEFRKSYHKSFSDMASRLRERWKMIAKGDGNTSLEDLKTMAKDDAGQSKERLSETEIAAAAAVLLDQMLRQSLSVELANLTERKNGTRDELRQAQLTSDARESLETIVYLLKSPTKSNHVLLIRQIKIAQKLIKQLIDSYREETSTKESRLIEIPERMGKELNALVKKFRAQLEDLYSKGEFSTSDSLGEIETKLVEMERKDLMTLALDEENPGVILGSSNDSVSPRLKAILASDQAQEDAEGASGKCETEFEAKKTSLTRRIQSILQSKFSHQR